MADKLRIVASATDITQGDVVELNAYTVGSDVQLFGGALRWTFDNPISGKNEELEIVDPNTDQPVPNSTSRPPVYWSTANRPPGRYTIHATATATAGSTTLQVKPAASVTVSMSRTKRPVTPDVSLWTLIRQSSEGTSFNNYEKFIEALLCLAENSNNPSEKTRDALGKRRLLPFNDADAYRILKVATEAFIEVQCAVLDPEHGLKFTSGDSVNTSQRLGTRVSPAELRGLASEYLGDESLLPYIAVLVDKLRAAGLSGRFRERLFRDAATFDNSNSHSHSHSHFDERRCEDIERKRAYPCLLELIWSYWHEEGMLVQTLAAITRRFQNVRAVGAIDPLVNLEIDFLRPINNILWGYLQDEQHRLGLMRRAYEYDHHYGITVHGRAVGSVRGADSRSKFLEAFHNLLYLCGIFYKEDDDTTIVADGFTVLHALKEVHLLLSQGAHNQFGDLPSTARQEMLVQQWILARPEFREYLPTRNSVAYPEKWMDRVDAMKALQGWTDVSVLHFSNLGTFGERILLSIRYGHWNDVIDPNQAANWARFWRQEVQGYTHAYRAATGVDLTIEVTDPIQASARYLPPAIHLRNRLAGQRRQLAAGGAYADAPAVPMRQLVRRGPRRPL